MSAWVPPMVVGVTTAESHQVVHGRLLEQAGDVGHELLSGRHQGRAQVPSGQVVLLRAVGSVLFRFVVVSRFHLASTASK